MKSENSSVLSNDDLGMSKLHRAFFKERNLAYPYLESPLNNNIVSPLSDYVHVPDEYMHGLAARQALPKLELNRLATDLVSFYFIVSNGTGFSYPAGKGTEVPSFSRDKGTTGQAQNLAMGRAEKRI